MDVDITTLATMQGALTSITDEMSQVVVRTARSPVFKLAKDFSCTLCDWQARQMIQGDAELPVHVGSIPFVCQAAAEAYAGNIAPGDTFLCNDPAFGGLHLNDVALLRPIFVEDELLFWAVIRAHWLDIGGPSPADLRRAQSDSYGEGVRIPPLKIIAAGEPCDDVMRLYFNNIRFPQTQHSDMLAMIAAAEIAGRRLTTMAHKYGVEVTKAGVEALYEMTERRVRKAIGALPDGVSQGCSWLSAREGDDHIKIAAEVTVSGEEMSINLTSPTQLREVRNSPFGATHAAVGHAVTIALGLQPPFNDGVYRPLTIDYGPLGTLTNAQVHRPWAVPRNRFARSSIVCVTPSRKLSPWSVKPQAGGRRPVSCWQAFIPIPEISTAISIPMAVVRAAVVPPMARTGGRASALRIPVVRS
jgi:N-methylhydantoinase B